MKFMDRDRQKIMHKNTQYTSEAAQKILDRKKVVCFSNNIQKQSNIKLFITSLNHFFARNSSFSLHTELFIEKGKSLFRQSNCLVSVKCKCKFVKRLSVHVNLILTLLLSKLTNHQDHPLASSLLRMKVPPNLSSSPFFIYLLHPSFPRLLSLTLPTPYSTIDDYRSLLVSF